MSANKSNATLNNFYNLSSSTLSIKYFSSILPYRVIENLSPSNLSQKNLTARISTSGWAWFVSGRKLFVWRYSDDNAGNKHKASKCYELLLPSSDISHKAELVCVLTQSYKENRFPCAIAVSPEGLIRFWPNIFLENNSIDSVITTDISGQECQLLIDIQSLGCIVGTTTNSLVHICVDFNSNQPVITCHTLKPPQGIFSGIGKRFSSFIFGSLPTVNYGDSRQLIRIIHNEPNDDSPQYILVLYNCSIQKWLIEDFDSETFCGEIDLEKQLKEAFINKFWNRTTTHHNQISIWLMDIGLNRFDDIVILSMCNNSDIPNENHFALVTLSADVFHSNGSSINQTNLPIKSVQYLNDINFSTISNTSLIQNKPFNIMCQMDSGKEVCFLYNSSKLYRINLNSNQNAMEEIDFYMSNDYLLGAIFTDNTLLLLTFKNGFISINSNQMNSNTPKRLSSVDKEFVITKTMDKFSIVKRALCLFLKDEKTRAELLLQEAFPFLKSSENKSNNSIELDETICSISVDICDHIPNADPRWSNFVEAENLYSENCHSDTFGSVLITNQLEDKLSTHNSFLKFLKQTNALDSLTSLTLPESILPTKLILSEHAEKLLVCLSLRKLHNKFGNIIEKAIKKVLEKRKLDKKLLENSHLTSQDLFYCEVTKVDDLFWQLVELEEAQLNFDHSPSDENIIVSITEIMTTVFSEVCVYRQMNGSLYQSAMVADCDYVPWSSDKNVAGVRETWLKQFDLFVRCFRYDSQMSTSNGEDQLVVAGQKLVELIDIILDSFTCQLSYLNKQNEKYATLKGAFEATRYKCLSTLLQMKQYEKAALLAEKYEDFDILIKLCEELNDQNQLQQYSQRFADKGFSEYLFEWYLKEGKQGKMLQSVTNTNKLDEFLSNHDSLKWLHQIHLKKFKEVSSTLKKISSLEENNPERKKTMLSIGKLALLANEDSSCNDFDDEIRFLNYQLELSELLLAGNNLDQKNMKVLSPKELVDIFTSNVNGSPLTEQLENFQKALEIAEIIERNYSKEIHQEIFLKIWHRAFIYDNWDEYSTDNLEVLIKRSFFYQLALNYYGDETKKLPNLDLLLPFVMENQKSSYFLRATYEILLNNMTIIN